MKNNNSYTNLSEYIGKVTQAYNTPDEAVVFAAAPGAKCCYHQTDVISHSQAANAIAYGQIRGIDIEVLALTATFKFLTFKQLDDLLTLRQKSHSENSLISSLDRLFRYNMLRINHFSTNKELCVYSLDNYGDETTSVLDIPHSFSHMQVALPAEDVMQVLEQNNAWIAFVKSDLNLNFIRLREVITLKSDKAVGVRPTLGICINDEPLFFEVVRRGEAWKAELLGKLKRYKKLIDNWSNTTWELQSKPLIIINGESEAHNRQIFQIASEAGLKDVFFTEDVLLSSEHFYHSIYRILQNNREFFCFEQKVA